MALAEGPWQTTERQFDSLDFSNVPTPVKNYLKDELRAGRMNLGSIQNLVSGHVDIGQWLLSPGHENFPGQRGQLSALMPTTPPPVQKVAQDTQQTQQPPPVVTQPPPGPAPGSAAGGPSQFPNAPPPLSTFIQAAQQLSPEDRAFMQEMFNTAVSYGGSGTDVYAIDPAGVRETGRTAQWVQDDFMSKFLADPVGYTQSLRAATTPPDTSTPPSTSYAQDNPLNAYFPGFVGGPGQLDWKLLDPNNPASPLYKGPGPGTPPSGDGQQPPSGDGQQPPSGVVSLKPPPGRTGSGPGGEMVPGVDYFPANWNTGPVVKNVIGQLGGPVEPTTLHTDEGDPYVSPKVFVDEAGGPTDLAQTAPDVPTDAKGNVLSLTGRVTPEDGAVTGVTGVTGQGGAAGKTIVPIGRTGVTDTRAVISDEDIETERSRNEAPPENIGPGGETITYGDQVVPGGPDLGGVEPGTNPFPGDPTPFFPEGVAAGKTVVVDDADALPTPPTMQISHPLPGGIPRYEDWNGDGLDDTLLIDKATYDERYPEARLLYSDDYRYSPGYNTALRNLYSKLEDENKTPEQLNAITNSILQLENLPSQDYFMANFPSGVESISQLFNIAGQEMVQPYDLPGPGVSADYDPEGFYAGGEAGQEWNDWLMGLIRGTNLPAPNLGDPATAAGALTVPGSISEARAPDATIDDSTTAPISDRAYGEWENPYLPAVEEEFDERGRQLESMLAATGQSNSTMAQEQRDRLAEAKSRAVADARLRYETVMGGERRADATTIANILNTLYGQQMTGAGFDRDTGQMYGGEKRANLELVSNILQNLYGQGVTGTQLGLQKAGAAGGAISQADAMDLQRRAGEAQRLAAGETSEQRIFDNLMTLLLTPENIRTGRFGMVQQPLSMLLSALSGVNVAPGTIGAAQMPAQRPPGPGAGELFGNLLGGLIGAGGQMGAGYLGRG